MKHGILNAILLLAMLHCPLFAQAGASVQGDTAFIVAFLRNAEADVNDMPAKDISKKYSRSLEKQGYHYKGKKCHEDYDRKMRGTHVYCKRCHVNRNDSIDFMQADGAMVGFLNYGFGPAVVFSTADRALCEAVLLELLKDSFAVESADSTAGLYVQYIRPGLEEDTYLQYSVTEEGRAAICSIMVWRYPKSLLEDGEPLSFRMQEEKGGRMAAMRDFFAIFAAVKGRAAAAGLSRHQHFRRWSTARLSTSRWGRCCFWKRR